jgi:tRNA A-37 threonylcarbamoyl transferase component Bud32
LSFDFITVVHYDSTEFLGGVMVQVDGFDELELIGVGANARVYSGRDIDHDRPVAIKLIQPGTDLEAIQRRFNRERKALGRLSQVANVVTIYHSGITEDGEPFLVMPRLASSLQDAVDDGGLPWRQAVKMIRAVSSAIDHAHEVGILHLDLKPANILLGKDKEPQVADFGIAEFIGSTASKSGALLTPDYSAPERFEDAAPSESMDVYALGACLYALLAGTPPFSDETTTGPASVMRRVMNDPVPLDALPADAPDALRSLVKQTLEKDPVQRPATAAEFSTALSAILDGRTGHTSTAARTAGTLPFEPDTQLDTTEPAGASGRLMAAALVAVVVVVSGAFALSRNQDGSTGTVDIEVAGASETTTTEVAADTEGRSEPSVIRSRTLTINDGVQEYIETTLLGSGGTRVVLVEGDPRGDLKANGEYIHERESDSAYTFQFVVDELNQAGVGLARWNIRVTVAAKLDLAIPECPTLEIRDLTASVESSSVVVITWGTNTPATEIVRSQADGSSAQLSNPSGNFYEDFTHRLGDLAWSGVEPLTGDTRYDFWVTLTSQCDTTDSVTEQISFTTAAE